MQESEDPGYGILKEPYRWIACLTYLYEAVTTAWTLVYTVIQAEEPISLNGFCLPTTETTRNPLGLRMLGRVRSGRLYCLCVHGRQGDMAQWRSGYCTLGALDFALPAMFAATRVQGVCKPQLRQAFEPAGWTE